jgi:hypothetical protein
LSDDQTRGSKDDDNVRDWSSLDDMAADIAARWNEMLDRLAAIDETPGMRATGDVSWRELASCKGTYLEVFFPDGGGEYALAAAREWCDDCPVKAECRQYAEDHNLPDGVWGGERQGHRRRRKRRDQMRNRRAKAAAGHDT